MNPASGRSIKVCHANTAGCTIALIVTNRNERTVAKSDPSLAG